MKRRLLWGWVTVALSFVVACSDGSDGAGGKGGTGATGGSVDIPIPCIDDTPLCKVCPTETCESNDECELGSLCLASDCVAVADGELIRTCVQVSNPACGAEGQCSTCRECKDLSEQYGVDSGSQRPREMRCVRVAESAECPQCNSSFDCPAGYECEGSAADRRCVNRRLPCELNEHCPKNHSCVGLLDAQFCVRVHQSCNTDRDCLDLQSLCADVDGDGSKECAPTLDPNAPAPAACLNQDCDGGTPVCEFSAVGSSASCGEYGLCRPGMDDCPANFDCVALWLDGRSECVPPGGSCSHISDCPPGQVCASARAGGPPSCQAGYSE